jgi:NADPH:quinone reductase-like Zn-dependent oxidoreductase
MMRAIVISRYGAPEVLVETELPDPVPGEGEVLIRVKAFGLNHAECYFRSGAWGDVARVTGIECAGIVDTDLTGTFVPGSPVVAILGGMGRTRNGSYAELVTVPVSNVAAIEFDLDWHVMAAVPEVFATAWSGLHLNLDVQPGQRVLVRGATSAVGQAAVQLGAAHGCWVVATSRSDRRNDRLRKLGAGEVLIDDGSLGVQLRSGSGPVDRVFDLIGNAALRDSLACLERDGRLCQVGFLGGLAPVEDFLPMLDLPTGVQLSFYGSAFVLGSPAYPLTEVPLGAIFEQVASGKLEGGPVRVFTFSDVVEAHRVLESGRAGGKMVVTAP